MIFFKISSYIADDINANIITNTEKELIIIENKFFFKLNKDDDFPFNKFNSFSNISKESFS